MKLTRRVLTALIAVVVVMTLDRSSVRADYPTLDILAMYSTFRIVMLPYAWQTETISAAADYDSTNVTMTAQGVSGSGIVSIYTKTYSYKERDGAAFTIPYSNLGACTFNYLGETIYNGRCNRTDHKIRSAEIIYNTYVLDKMPDYVAYPVPFRHAIIRHELMHVLGGDDHVPECSDSTVFHEKITDCGGFPYFPTALTTSDRAFINLHYPSGP